MNNSDDQIVKIAKALSDKTRVQIIRELSEKGKITCSEAGKIAHLSQPTMSHHIKILVDADLLSTEKQGRHVILWVNKKSLDNFTQLLGKTTKV